MTEPNFLLTNRASAARVNAMASIVLTLPIMAGKVEAWKRFCQEMSGARQKMYEASRQRLGITREQLALVETPFGSAAVTTLEAFDVGETIYQIMASARPFDRWYREQMQELHGFHLAGYEQFVHPLKVATDQKVHFEWTSNSHLN